MTWLPTDLLTLLGTAVKAAVMVLVAVLGLRLGERRTLAQLTVIDVVTAVSLGAVVGRTALAESQALLTGVVALLTIVLTHRLLSLARMQPRVGRLLRHRVRVLVRDGVVQQHELRRSRLTLHDLHAQLRKQGVIDLDTLRWVLYESEGRLSLVRRDAPEHQPLVDEALEDHTAR